MEVKGSELTCHINVNESTVEHVVVRYTAAETGQYLISGLHLSPCSAI